LLLAQLEDARDEQTRSAALAERGRIAEELHDVLAHSLSGLAIQLEVARKQAGQEDASSSLKQTIDTAGQLTRAGLGDARRAVNALRGEELPKLGQLASLLDTYRRDLHVDVSLTVEGEIRPLPAQTEFALYRGVQEALTNVARHAPGAATAVTLRYSPDCATVTITDRARAEEEIPAPASATSFGGGNGLTGMRERMTRVGGAMTAGPTPTGWTVVLETPV
jgi:signal transduction histidine kinase